MNDPRRRGIQHRVWRFGPDAYASISYWERQGILRGSLDELPEDELDLLSELFAELAHDDRYRAEAPVEVPEWEYLPEHTQQTLKRNTKRLHSHARAGGKRTHVVRSTFVPHQEEAHA